MSTRGFIVNIADVAGITTAYDLAKAVKLIGVAKTDPPVAAPTIADTRARPMPMECIPDSIEGHLLVTGGAPTQASLVLAWDANGDFYFTNEVTVDLVAGLTTATLRSFNADIGVYRIRPDETDALITDTEYGSVWAFLKVNGGGTVTLKRLVLNWQRDGR